MYVSERSAGPYGSDRTAQAGNSGNAEAEAEREGYVTMSTDIQNLQSDLNLLLADAHRQIEIINGVRSVVDWMARHNQDVERVLGHLAPKQQMPPTPRPGEAVPLSHEEWERRRAEALRPD